MKCPCQDSCHMSPPLPLPAEDQLIVPGRVPLQRQSGDLPGRVELKTHERSVRARTPPAAEPGILMPALEREAAAGRDEQLELSILERRQRDFAAIVVVINALQRLTVRARIGALYS